MILITGITGKSGLYFFQNIINDKKLKNEKFRVVVRQTSNTDFIDKSGICIEKAIGDLNNLKFIEEAMKDIDVVFHIAGIHFSLNVIEAAIKNNVKWVILVHTTGIFSKYKSAAAQYRDIENRINLLKSNSKLDLTILRPTMIYGDIEDRNISIFIKIVDKIQIIPVINHGNYHLQPVHAKDLGNAYYQVLLNESKTKNKCYNLSGREPILLIDMLKIISKELGVSRKFFSVPFPVAYAGAWMLFAISFGNIDYREKIQRMIESRAFSHEYARNDFGYNPMSFQEGIKDEICKYRQRMKKSEFHIC